MSALRREQFLQSDPAGYPSPLRALWHEARGDWARAHEEAQDGNDAASALVHAYLHRKEGDAGNAAYWYRVAGRPVCTTSLAEEWQALAQEFMSTLGAE